MTSHQKNNEKIEIIEKRIESLKLKIEEKNTLKNKRNLKSFASDFFFNILASVIIFFIVKNNFEFFKKKKFFLALLLIFLVLSSLYITLKKYAYIESNASI